MNDYDKKLNDELLKAIRNSTFYGEEDTSDHTQENKDILLDIVKKQYGISDEQMSEMTPDEMKAHIRNQKMNKLV